MVVAASRMDLMLVDCIGGMDVNVFRTVCSLIFRCFLLFRLFRPPNTYIKQLPFSWSASFRSLFSQTRECFQSNERARDKRGQMASASRKRFAAFPASFAPSMLANEEVELVACKSVSASQREFKFLAGEH